VQRVRQLLEQRERDERGRALAVRRELAHLDVAVAQAQRLDPLRAVCAEIGGREPGRRSDRLRHEALVEAARAIERDCSQRPRQLGERVDLAEAGGRSRGAIAGQRPVLGDTLRRGDPVLRRVDRGAERRIEAQPAEALRQVGPGANGTGNRDRTRAALVHAQLGQLARRTAGAVKAVQLSVPPDLREEIPADAGVPRLGHAEHRSGRERGVDGVAAAFECSHARPRRQRMARRHHRLPENGGPPHWLGCRPC
jgi:hypothetical protein